MSSVGTKRTNADKHEPHQVPAQRPSAVVPPRRRTHARTPEKSSGVTAEKSAIAELEARVERDRVRMPVDALAEDQTARAQARREDGEHGPGRRGRGAENEPEARKSRDLVDERARAGAEDERGQLGRERARGAFRTCTMRHRPGAR